MKRVSNDDTSDGEADMISLDSDSSGGSSQISWAESSGAINVVDATTGSAGLVVTSANILNSILGAGILGMPFAVKNAGFVFGIALLAILGLLTAFGVELIVACGARQMPPLESYSEVAGRALGPVGSYSVPIFMLLFTYGAMSGYGIIVADAFPEVVQGLFGMQGGEWWLDRTTIIITFTCLVFLPLSLYRDIAKLGRFSIFAMIALLGVAVLVFAQMVQAIGRGDAEFTFSWIRPRFFPAIGVLSGAYVCHHNSFLLFRSLHNRTQTRWAQASRSAVLSAFSLLSVVGICGFITFGNSTDGNILNNLGKDPVTQTARMAMVTVVALTYPLEAFVAREALGILVSAVERRFRLSSYFPGYRLKRIARNESFGHWTLTLVIVTIAMVTSLSVRELGAVFELNGGLNAVALAYVLPALIGLKLHPNVLWRRDKSAACGVRFSLTKLLCLALAGVGGVSMIASTTQVLAT